MKLFPKREISSYESVNLLFKMCLEMKNENIIILFINKFYNYLTKGNIKMLILNGCHKVLNNLLLNLKSLKNRLILILKEIRIEMLNWICQYGDFENIGEIFILLLTEDINKTLLLTYETMYVKLCQIAIKYKKIDIVDIILNYVYKIEHNQTSLLEEILQILETSIKYYDHEIFKKIIKFIKENGYNMYNEIYSYSVLLTCIEHGNEHIFDNLIDVLRLKENSYVTDGIIFDIIKYNLKDLLIKITSNFDIHKYSKNFIILNTLHWKEFNLFYFGLHKNDLTIKTKNVVFIKYCKYKEYEIIKEMIKTMSVKDMYKSYFEDGMRCLIDYDLSFKKQQNEILKLVLDKFKNNYNNIPYYLLDNMILINFHEPLIKSWDRYFNEEAKRHILNMSIKYNNTELILWIFNYDIHFVLSNLMFLKYLNKKQTFKLIYKKLYGEYTNKVVKNLLTYKKYEYVEIYKKYINLNETCE
jgi:hypothetical protein